MNIQKMLIFIIENTFVDTEVTMLTGVFDPKGNHPLQPYEIKIVSDIQNMLDFLRLYKIEAVVKHNCTKTYFYIESLNIDIVLKYPKR